MGIFRCLSLCRCGDFSCFGVCIETPWFSGGLRAGCWFLGCGEGLGLISGLVMICGNGCDLSRFGSIYFDLV